MCQYTEIKPITFDTSAVSCYDTGKENGVAKVRTRIVELMGAKQAQEGRRIRPIDVARESGVSIATIYRWMRDDIVRFDDTTIVSLCSYFGCDIGDLLYIDHTTNGS